MTSSSSDSDSDDLEPFRRIKINIKPKEEVKSSGADVDVIKASVEAWRPLGPRPHQALSRRKSSLSSVSSLSFGTGSNQGSGSGRGGGGSGGGGGGGSGGDAGCGGGTGTGTGTGSSVSTAATSSSGFNYSQQYGFGPLHMTGSMSSSSITRGNINDNSNADNNIAGKHNNTFMRSSPSCSSLVNDFTNRTSFSNFMSSVSRTSSPLTFMNNYGDTVPIALAIQESIELTVKGHQGPAQSEIKFDTRALGNIKVAFPNAFARSCSNGYKPSSALKLRLHGTDSILRYYASGLIKELGSESSSLNDSTSTNGLESEATSNCNIDLLDMNESPTMAKSSSKMIEFDIDALMTQLKQQYDRSPNGRYYNVDALRYQIAPIDKFERSPIQVCAYWRVEPKLIKLRIDFKHSSESGFNLERLREIAFSADLSNLVPSTMSIEAVTPDAFATLRPHKAENNNLTTFRNLSSDRTSGGSNEYARQPEQQWPHRQQQPVMQHSNHQYKNLINVSDTPQDEMQSAQSQASSKRSASIQIRLPPPPSRGQSRGQSTLARSNLSSSSSSIGSTNSLRRQQYVALDREPPVPAPRSSYLDVDLLTMDNAINQTASHDSNATPSCASEEASGNQQAPLMMSPAISANQMTQAATPGQSTSSTHGQVPYVTFEPQANWNPHTKQLTWKFDNLLSYYKTDGYGSLLAKLDFRQCPDASQEQQLLFANQAQLELQRATPRPVDVKFMVVDATVSKISLSVDSAGYRMSLLKKEVRSGRYKSEPYIS